MLYSSCHFESGHIINYYQILTDQITNVDRYFLADFKESQNQQEKILKATLDSSQTNINLTSLRCVYTQVLAIYLLCFSGQIF